jgi:uncharacterized RDD family membrane protein YckC
MRHNSDAVPAVRAASAVLVVAGVVVLVGALLADQLNLGGGGDGLGWKQLIGAIVGLVLLLIGLGWLTLPTARSRR